MTKPKRKFFSPREGKKARRVKIRSVNFLKKKKTISDKFSDIQKKYRSRSYVPNKDGEYVFSKRVYYNELKKGLNVSTTKQLKKYLSGNFTKNFSDKINRIHRKERKNENKTFDLFKKETKEYTPHSFTRSNFFKVQDRKIKNNEIVTFNVGVNVFFKSKTSNHFIKRDGEYMQVYEANDIPIPHMVRNVKKLSEAVEEMFDRIQVFIDNYKDRDSHILFFHFTRFIINIAEL